jgi:hypothetical protein
VLVRGWKNSLSSPEFFTSGGPETHFPAREEKKGSEQKFPLSTMDFFLYQERDFEENHGSSITIFYSL